MAAVDYSALLYDPVYDALGVPAVFTVAGGAAAAIYEPQYAIKGWFDDEASAIATFDEELRERTTQADITVIDDTRPKLIPIVTGTGTGNVATGTGNVRNVGPGAFARIPELEANGITRDDWLGATLVFNGRAWIVRSWDLRGSPNGEDLGEVRFLLKASDD